ncbi:MAG: zinc ribbon domain-containing protein [Nitrososphaeraceae archaeon]
MKVFNGRSATDEYMSTHSLTFSTPEMTLKKFALWLGDQVPGSGDSKNPRLLSYIEDLNDDDDERITEINPNVDDSFKPSGAVTDMYGPQTAPDIPNAQHSSHEFSIDSKDNLEGQGLEKHARLLERKYCTECGNSIGIYAKFCTRCGNKQN